MVPPIPDDFVPLPVVARQLGVQPTTLRYWLRVYGEFLPHTVSEAGEILFAPEQVAILRRIRTAALDDGLSERVIRAMLGETRPSAVDNTAHLIERLQEEIVALREEILFLTEESKEIQRMLGILLEVCLRGDNGLAPQPKPQVNAAATTEEEKTVKPWTPPRLTG